MNSGTVRATVKKQNVDFVIQTPTSVASVKGTDFGYYLTLFLGMKLLV